MFTQAPFGVPQPVARAVGFQNIDPLSERVQERLKLDDAFRIS